MAFYTEIKDYIEAIESITTIQEDFAPELDFSPLALSTQTVRAVVSLPSINPQQFFQVLQKSGSLPPDIIQINSKYGTIPPGLEFKTRFRSCTEFCVLLRGFRLYKLKVYSSTGVIQLPGSVEEDLKDFYGVCKLVCTFLSSVFEWDIHLLESSVQFDLRNYGSRLLFDSTRYKLSLQEITGLSSSYSTNGSRCRILYPGVTVTIFTSKEGGGRITFQGKDKNSHEKVYNTICLTLYENRGRILVC